MHKHHATNDLWLTFSQLWDQLLFINPQIKDARVNLNPRESVQCDPALPKVCAAFVVWQLEGTEYGETENK